LVTEQERGGKTIYLCDCGLGYGDILIAYACEEYRRMYGVNSEDIMKLAIYNPRTEGHAEIVAVDRLNSQTP
jgi:hypothetical protein